MDEFLTAAVVCRSTTGVCDPVENCTGTSGACPVVKIEDYERTTRPDLVKTRTSLVWG